MNIIKKLFFLMVFLAVLSLSVSAIEYYLDEEITLEKDGSAYVEGSTNLDILRKIKVSDEKVSGFTDELTSKSGSYWLFTYTYKEPISDYIIKLTLPVNVEINHINSKSKVLIGTYGQNQQLTFIAEDKPLDIKVQYTFNTINKDNKILGKLMAISLYIIVIIFIASIIFYFLKKRKKKAKKRSKKELDSEKLDTIKLTLNENQLKILEALIEKNGEASQTQLRYLTGVPKSSLSRNLELMSQKQVIAKFYSGTSNYIKIHPSLHKEE